MISATDRELLELAAKAAGISLRDLDDRWDCWEAEPILIHRGWNPLTDDGDAMRLVVMLGMCIKRDDPLSVWVANNMVESFFNARDPYAAARRAIVRAAAEIGKSMI